MESAVQQKEIRIRTTILPGDIGYATYLHGLLYSRENNYGIAFETYVAKGLCEFYEQYDPAMDRVWVCEQQEKMVGFLLLMHRSNQSAQLRYFLLLPEYRRLGLGRELMNRFMNFWKDAGFRHVYLWTTQEQIAAAALYLQYGFRLTEEKPSDLFGKSLIEQKYELGLA